MAGVGLGHLEQAALLAALGAVQAHAATALLAEPASDDVGVGELDREANLRGDVGGLIVVALDEAGLQLVFAHVGALVEDELDRADRAALSHDEDAGAADGLLAVEADEVEVDIGGERNLLLHVEGREPLQARLQAARSLEVELGGGLAHLVGELVHYGRALALQEILDLPHVASILDRVDRAAAGAGPTAHMVVEARAALACEHDIGDGGLVGLTFEDATGTLPFGAGGRADGDDLAQGVDGLARGLGVGVGPEVARALAMALARVLDRREDVGLGDRDIGVGLVVLEVDVEVGVVLGDKVALEHERLVLGAHDHVVEGLDHLHHEGDLLAVIGQSDVLLEPCAQVLGLAHVDDSAGRVTPQVAAGFGGHERDLLDKGRRAVDGACHMLARGLAALGVYALSAVRHLSDSCSLAHHAGFLPMGVS